MEIYFKDFKREVQEAILTLYGINDPKEMNWDVFPITFIPDPTHNGD